MTDNRLRSVSGSLWRRLMCVSRNRCSEVKLRQGSLPLSSLGSGRTVSGPVLE
ncbi:hypothetical protein E2C01_048600 [Portunus trituberculatus]|uniref:Uncharacterized protein n=1 Tax=Portunus trituberculatus TaxID=210409 RepID=A0A5B7GAZ5_PORTR|nr:hypothetical protein [Portunus trituberculatus]